MDISGMSDEDKIEAIRKACGWGDASRNPLEDLNCIHEAEKILRRDKQFYQPGGLGLYLINLEERCDEDDMLPDIATARQRVDAFLLTL